MHDKIFTRRGHSRCLRHARGAALAAALTLLCCWNSPAQKYPNGLSTGTVDADADARMIRQIRAHLDSVRAVEGRPVVGLVLSGGGAKGAAEAGALKYLREQGVPVDFVCGTSIGGLLGGLVATGYDPDEIIDVFKSQDWDRILTDKIDQSYVPYASKMYSSKYLFAIPFHYDKNVLQAKVDGSGEIEYSERTHADIGAGDDDDAMSGISKLAASLPSGYAYGLNVGNLISSLTVGYQDDMDFCNLPIPFVCVATDLVSGKAKNWGSGSLKTAMRSTMSIPGLFNPVRTDGMVLTDGGMRNNYPTDIARAVGCDYIIGIDLSDADLDYAQVNNIGSIISQGISMLGRETFERNIDNKGDVFIKPDLNGYNMLSFSEEAIDTMLVRGYNAAVAQTEQIKALKAKLGDAAQVYAHAPAVDISRQPVSVGSVEYAGVSSRDARYLAKKTGMKPMEFVNCWTISDAMSTLQATGAFESVTYSLLGTQAPYTLRFDCVPAPTHQLGVGFRIDSEEWASILLNAGLNSRKLTGAKADFTAKIGQNFKADFRLTLNTYWMPTVNFDASIERYKGEILEWLTDYSYSGTYLTMKERLYLSDINWTNVNFKMGVQNRYFILEDDSSLAKHIIDISGRDALQGSYLGAFLSGELYTFDNLYYPTRGVKLSFNASYDFLKSGVEDFNPILSSGIDLKAVIPMGRKVALIPDFHARNIFNKGQRSSVIHTNFVGGEIAGRYVSNQMPFFGFDSTMMASDIVASFTAEIRTEPMKNIYMSAMAGYLKSDNKFGDMVMSFKPDCWAVGLEAAYNSFLGPLKVNLHWSDLRGWGLYTSLGFDF